MRLSVASRRLKSQEQGFTLIETATALLVMMIGGLGICAVFAWAIKNNTGSRDRAASLAVAQQQMERYRQVQFIDPILTAQAATNQTLTSAGRDYRVRTTIVDTSSSLKTITIQVTPLFSSEPWAIGSVQITVQRSTFALGPYSGGT